MKQKIVVKLEMRCKKCRRKALQLAAQSSGVNSAGIEGEKMVVTGDGVDAVELVSLLRKKVGRAVIVSLGEDK